MGENLKDDLQDLRAPFGWLVKMLSLLMVLVCAAFTAIASAGLWVIFLKTGSGEGFPFMVKLFAKAVFFLATTIGAAWCLTSAATLGPRTVCRHVPYAAGQRRALLGLVLALALIGAAVAPNLNKFPWAAPDEAYHLVVARNLAEYGLYASGHPDKGFVLFDPYDSVGAPVIIPVAAAFRLLGVTLGSARLVMVAYFLLFCVGMYSLAAGVFGSGPAILGVIVLTASFGSTYLARTLYGEVPAFAFLVIGLLSWRYALQRPGVNVAACLAGLAFGAAVLCKSILALSVFAFLGTVVYDVLTFRRIRWPNVALPALAASCAVVAWWTLQSLAHYDVAGAVASTLAMYKHNLMFGWRSAGRAVAWMLQDPLALVSMLCALAVAAPTVFYKRYDPPLVTLFLVAVFYAYWWMFFTPAQIPRYMWFTYATGGMGAGIMLWHAVRMLITANTSVLMRGACIAALLLVLIPATTRASREIREVYTSDEMQDDRELAFLVQDLPESTFVLTTYWPLERSLNFLAHRAVQVVGTVPKSTGGKAVVIVDQQTQAYLLAGETPAMRIGRYAVLNKE